MTKGFEEFLDEIEAYTDRDLDEALDFLENTELVDNDLTDQMRIRAHREDDLRSDRYDQESVNHLYSLFDHRKILEENAGVSSAFFKNGPTKIENGILLDHNLLMAPADKTRWSVTARLNEEQLGWLVDNGLVPEDENYDLGRENQYTYRNEFTWERVFDVMSAAKEEDLVVAYPGNLGDVMRKNDYSETLVSEYEDWLPKAAQPVPISDYGDFTLEDAQISAAAEDRGLTVVTGDSDFPERVGEIARINPDFQSLDQAYRDLTG